MQTPWLVTRVALLLVFSNGASAQGKMVLEEILVTAEARTENLQEVPVAVTAFSSTEILSAGIQSTADFIALTPNVTFDDSFTIGNSFVSLRGVTQINNADSPVAIVVDGVPQNNQKQFKMDLYDVERIEILKGPQGALYGRNAIGGAVVIATRQPTNEFEGFVEGGVGNDGFVRATAAVSGPIVEDKLLFRLAGSYKESDGQITNTYLGKEVDFYESTDIRGKLTWHPSDAVIVDFRLATSQLEGGALYDVAFFDDSGPDNTNTERSPITNVLGDSTRDIDESTLKLDWLGDIGTFTSITAYTDISEDYYGDLDFCNPEDCPGGFFGLGQVTQAQDLEVKLFSQELRFTSPDEEDFRWAAGAYYLRSDRNLGSRAFLQDFGDIPLANIQEDNDNRAWAVFGQADYSFGDEWEISASLRYDDDKREQTDAFSGGSRDTSFDAWQPKITASWYLAEEQLLYATYARGFRSGGFNGIGGREFVDETIDNYEIGYKSTHLDNRLRLNAAAFYAQSNDFQFFFVDFNAGGAQVIDNLDEVTLQGAEVEVEALVNENLRIFGSLGVLDSTIDAISPDLQVPAEEGNKSPKTTEYTLNIGTELVFEVGQLAATLRLDFERRGDKYWQTDNVDVMDPVNLVNLRASLGGEQWTATLWGRNIGDEFYYEDFNATPFTGLPWNIGFPTQLATYGFDFRYNF